MVENIVREGEIACYKHFLLFLQCFPQLYIFSASKCVLCGNGLIKFDQGSQTFENWPHAYKTFFMLNSAEHEISKLDKSNLKNHLG